MFARLALILVAMSFVGVGDKVSKETIDSGGKARTYYLYVPDDLPPDAPVPLVLLLHGSGRDGKTLVDPWKELAKREGLILAAPDSTDRQGWNLKLDSHVLMADLVDKLRSSHRIDLRRLYLFGHSAGAIHALMLGLLQSEYFAAVGVHAGALPRDSGPILELADRKIPVGIWVGTDDRFFPVDAVKATAAALESKGIRAHLRIINHHTHNYYQRSGPINDEVWTFLKGHRLEHDPRFKEYDLK